MVRLINVVGALALLIAPSLAQNLDTQQTKLNQNETRIVESTSTQKSSTSDISFLKEDKHHPQVQGQANYINLELRGNSDYHGPMYIGSQYREVNMIYDTASQEVIVLNAGIENLDIISNYDVEESKTAVQQKKGLSPDLKGQVFGSVDFEGIEYTDKMCLSQTTNDRSDSTGHMCVRNMPFIDVTQIIGSFEANGIIGLGPNAHELSYVQQLFDQGQIEEKKVGLNFENPKDSSSISTISFGYYDYSQIQNGTDGVNYYSNIGLNHWAMLMDDVQYGSSEIGQGLSGKMAIIDSGNTSIQIPASQFKQLKAQMQIQDSSVTTQTVDDKEILVSRKQCKDLYNVFSDLRFMLQSTQITIKPEGYLFSLGGGQSDCFIGIQSIPDKFNQYRLGTIFLRNFYTGLDYENNLVILGLNNGITTAELIGKTANPFIVEQGNGALVFVIIFVIIMIIVAAACYIRAKRIEKRNIVEFNHVNTDELKKKYKNGVEIKPSDLKKDKKQAINDTMDEEDQEETLLDEE